MKILIYQAATDSPKDQLQELIDNEKLMCFQHNQLVSESESTLKWNRVEKHCSGYAQLLLTHSDFFPVPLNVQGGAPSS